MQIQAIKDALRDKFGLTTCPLCKTGSFEVKPRLVMIIDKPPRSQTISVGPGRPGTLSLSGENLIYTSCSDCGYVLLFDPAKLGKNISESED